VSINSSISKVRSLLLNPKSNRPTVDQLFSNLTDEFQAFYNELETSSQPWTYNEVTVNVNAGVYDYLVPVTTGKVLFATAYPQDTNFGPIALEIADLAEVTSNFFLYSPLDWGFSRDFNEVINLPFPFQIAFYRKGGDLWFRLAPFSYALTSITITYSTGDWLQNLNVNTTAVLPNHHGLVETRTAMNLLPGCEWSADVNRDDLKRKNLAMSLSTQAQRYSRNFMYAKRNLGGDAVTDRSVFGEYY
jgi:hypothetical protein